ncbi:MAG: DUF4340 domain-containing protein [Anaerolineae bacterium]|jgi:hypothetical protein|nr:DUF4340 domain-containing protein [Anaerolineae bacterium]
MTRELRLVLIAAGVVAVLAVTSLLLWLNPVEVQDTLITLKAVEPVNVSRVAIHNQYGTIDIRYMDEGYEVDDIPADLVDMDEFIDLLTDCGQVMALRIVAEAPQDAAPYGLDQPTARVGITYDDGTSLTLLVGAEEQVSGDFYASVEGSPAIYLMEADRCTGFLVPKKAYVEDLVTPRLAISSPLSALLNVTFAGGTLAEPVTIEAVATGDPALIQAALSFGAPTHLVRGRGTYELDQTYGVQMLGPLLGITAIDIVDYGLTPEEIAAFGFDHPTMQVTFDLKNGVEAETEHFDLNLLCRDDGCYMTCNDRGLIYAVEQPAWLNLEYDKLLVRWFLSPLLQDVREVELTTGGESYRFVITGESNADKRVTCNGEDLDIERFRVLYRLLTSAAHDGRLLDDIAVEGVPLLQLTYRYVDDRKPPDVMALYAGDSRRVYVQVNGMTELAMQETYLVRVQEALAVLWSDDPIATEW